MDILQTIFFTLIALGVLVSFHEYGHFWVARRCGVKVLKFSIGFGAPLVRWTDSKGTEFIIAALPLGGYVKMVDEREGNVSEEDLPQAFTRKSVWQRIAIVAAGPAANFLLAIVAFWIVFLSGERGLAPVAGEIASDSLAAQSGFETGTEIIAVDGVPTKTWSAVSRQLFGFIGTTGDIPFTVTYPDSTIQYQLLVPVNKWLRDREEPSPLRELGIQPPFQLESLSLAAVSEEGAGYRAGLRAGDRLLAINGVDITNINSFIDTVASSAGVTVELLVERDAGQQLSLQAFPQLGLRIAALRGELDTQLPYHFAIPRHQLRNSLETELLASIALHQQLHSDPGTGSHCIYKAVNTGDIDPVNGQQPIPGAQPGPVASPLL